MPSSSLNPSPHRDRNPHRARILILCIAVVAAAAAAFCLPFILSGAQATVSVKIPANASTAQLSDTLVKYFGSSYAGRVMTLTKFSGSDLSSRHGAYLIEKGTSPLRAMRKLTRGAQTPLTITVNGFRSLPLLAERIASRLDFSADSLLTAATDPKFLKNYDLSPENALALFVDDSYEVYWSASPQEVLEKVGANYRRLWNQERTAKAKSLGIKPEELMILCSIVDEETLKADEKGAIGRLYINRLQRGMKLQADPTVRFAVGDFTIRRVQGVHLKTDSPYNTYLHKGLPPGPIRTTSARTVDLVLNAPPSDAIYMCARPDFSGYHDFAATYPEHQANAQRYRQALDDRGIR